MLNLALTFQLIHDKNILLSCAKLIKFNYHPL